MIAKENHTFFKEIKPYKNDNVSKIYNQNFCKYYK